MQWCIYYEYDTGASLIQLIDKNFAYPIGVY